MDKGDAMASGKSFIASRRADHAHVERTALLEELDAELARSGIVVLCAPWGYGKTDLMADYARIAHARMPLRPVVRVDFASPEAQAFLNGSMRLLRHALEREARGALWLSESCLQRNGGEGPNAGSGANGGEAPPLETAAKAIARVTGGEHRRRAAATPEVRLLHAYLEVLAPRWYGRCAGGARCGEVAFGDVPLLVIDNLPFVNEERAGELADAVRLWVREGARVLMGCTPSTRVACSQLSEACVVTSEMMAVSSGELGEWARELRLPSDADLLALTRGVPYLVDACRSKLPEGPGEGTYGRAVDRVVDHCLDEAMCVAAEHARWAMVMLGEGRLGDLTAVGAALREDELGILAAAFPLFGIDRVTGGFACLPLAVSHETKSVVRAATGSEALSERCVELLIARGCIERAGALATLLSDGVRLRLYAAHPDVFADAAYDGSIARSLRSAALGDGVDCSLRSGLARLARMHALAHDLPVRALSEQAVRYSAGTSEGALRALRSVLGYWRDAAGGAGGGAFETRLAEGELGGGDGRDPHRAVGSSGTGYLEGYGVSVGPALGDGDDGVVDIDAVVTSLGSAALHGDAALYGERLQRLRRVVPFARGGLAAAVYAAHAAVCGLLCNQAEMVLAWIEPFAERCHAARANPDRAGTVADALFGSVQSVARVLVEKPSALGTAQGSLEVLRDARLFFEARDIAPGVAFVSALEAFCLLVTGGERRAEGLLAACQARWGVQGTLAGQLFASLGLAVTGLAKDEVNQARVHAQTAELLAHRLGLQRGVWIARLFETVAAIRNGNGPDLDRRLLEATLRQSSLHPAVSVPLNIEMAFLYAAAGEGSQARDIFQSVNLFGHPAACRLLVVAVRALGRERSCVLDVLPRAMRSEYESLRPSRLLRKGSGDVRDTERPGMLALARPGSGLSIALFGSFKVSVNGHPMEDTEWGRRKARSLLVLLALHPGTPLSRDAIIGALWAERSSAFARNNLNTTLTSLRTSLGQKNGGPQYIVASGNALSLSQSLVDTDVQRFERLARTVLTRREGTDPSEVIDACSVLEQIYQTGLAADVEDLAPFVDARVEELAALFVGCMVVGSELALAEDDAQLALWFARAAVRANPKRDDVRRAVGDAVAAIDGHGQMDEGNLKAAVDEVLAEEAAALLERGQKARGAAFCGSGSGAKRNRAARVQGKGGRSERAAPTASARVPGPLTV